MVRKEVRAFIHHLSYFQSLKLLSHFFDLKVLFGVLFGVLFPSFSSFLQRFAKTKSLFKKTPLKTQIRLKMTNSF